MAPKLNALASMIELEARTYFTWLASPEMVLAEVERCFVIEDRVTRWGKLRLRCRRRDLGGAQT